MNVNANQNVPINPGGYSNLWGSQQRQQQALPLAQMTYAPFQPALAPAPVQQQQAQLWGLVNGTYVNGAQAQSTATSCSRIRRNQYRPDVSNNKAPLPWWIQNQSLQQDQPILQNQPVQSAFAGQAPQQPMATQSQPPIASQVFPPSANSVNNIQAFFASQPAVAPWIPQLPQNVSAAWESRKAYGGGTAPVFQFPPATGASAVATEQPQQVGTIWNPYAAPATTAAVTASSNKRSSRRLSAAEKEAYFVPGNPLTDEQKRYMRCLLHVGSTNKKGIKSPYGICTDSVGTQVRNAAQYYMWENIPNDEIAGYLRRYGIPADPNSPHDDLVRLAYQFAASKRGQ